MFTRSFTTLIVAALAVTQLAAAIPHGLRHNRRHPNPVVVTVVTTAATVYVDQYGATVDPNAPPPPVIVTVTAGGDAAAPPATTPTPAPAAATTPAAVYEPAPQEPAPEPTTPKSTPKAEPTTKKETPKAEPTTKKETPKAEPTTKKETAPTTTAAPPPAETKPVETPKSSSAAPKPSASAPAAPAGNKPGITYSPWEAGAGEGDRVCKSDSQIAEEVAKIKDFSPIRLYDGGCKSIEAVISGTSSKLFIGVDGTGDVAEELKTVTGAIGSNWDRIETVAVGNEHIEFGRMTVDELLGKISEAREILSSYKGPIVTVETVNAWGNNPKLCSASDYVATNAHPFFAHQAADQVETFMGNEMKNIKDKISANGCADKTVKFVEAGWPSGGSPLDAAVPGEAEQKVAIAGIVKAMDNDVILFSSFDENWKPDTGATSGTEKHWGVKDLSLA